MGPFWVSQTGPEANNTQVHSNSLGFGPILEARTTHPWWLALRYLAVIPTWQVLTRCQGETKEGAVAHLALSTVTWLPHPCAVVGCMNEVMSSMLPDWVGGGWAGKL